MKFNKNLLKEKWFSYTIALCSAVVLYLLLTHVSGILNLLGSIWHVCAPVFMAFVIAYVLDPLENVFSKYVFYKVEQKKLRHTLSVIFSFLSVILFITVLVVALVPQVIDSVVMFAGNLNGYVLSFQRLMRQLNSFALQHDLDLSKFISSSDELLQSITRILPENLNKIVNASYSFGAKMFDWIISFILAIYLMMDQRKLKDGFSRLLRAILPDQAYRNTASFWRRCNKILIQYIAFDLLDGMIIGMCNWVFMVLMGMPYIAIISVVVGVTNLAPTFGPMIGALIGSFILVLVKPWYALVFLMFTLILQTLDGYVIKPRLFGEQLGVSSVWILISLVVGGRLMGVPGILLAIPFAAIVDFVYQDYIIKWLEQQNEEHKKTKQGQLSGIATASGIAADTAAELGSAAASAVTTAEAAAAAAESEAADTNAADGTVPSADAEAAADANAAGAPDSSVDAEPTVGADSPESPGESETAAAADSPVSSADAEVAADANAAGAPDSSADAEISASDVKSIPDSSADAEAAVADMTDSVSVSPNVESILTAAEGATPDSSPEDCKEQ